MTTEKALISGIIDIEKNTNHTGKIVLSNGENIPAELLENELLSFPEIEECVVFEKNDLIHAMIVPSGMQSVEKEDLYRKIGEIVTSVNSAHPSYSRIYRWELRDAPFEKTTSGKIRRMVNQ